MKNIFDCFLNILHVLIPEVYGSFFFGKTVITMINQAIGANGVASQECKAVVEQYGQTIIDLLVAEVNTWLLLIFIFCFFSSGNKAFILFYPFHNEWKRFCLSMSIHLCPLQNVPVNSIIELSSSFHCA